MPSQKKKTSSPSVKEEQSIQSVKGMHDILPKDGALWQFFTEKGKEVAELFGFYFVETPMVEEARLFEASVGAATDIVEKEMYFLKSRGSDRLALRPEETAGLMRSFLQHHLGHIASPLRVYHHGPVFRYEKPQAGRFRQFHQWDYDIIGESDPWYDAQVIQALLMHLEIIGMKKVCVRINTVGCRVCRLNYRKKLLAYYKEVKNRLCSDCERRYEKNPLRLLDCKKPECGGELKTGAPIILDYLCQSCNAHFKGALEFLEESNINYEPDPHLVRGLDYYNKLVFEIFVENNPNALAGGGRYDYLGEILGGRVIPAVGGAIGMERIIELLKEAEGEHRTRGRMRVFFVAIGDQAKKTGIRTVQTLRRAHVAVSETVGKKSMSAQMKQADKSGAALAVIVGQRECFEGTVILRDMTSGAQETVPGERLVEEIKKRLK